MGNPITDFMTNWLNTTYQYLKETGGPTYPPITVGPNVLPTGPYSPVEEYPVNYGTIPFPFNPGTMGLPAVIPNNIDTNEEIAKENPAPVTFSNAFGLVYGGMMNACIADQKHVHNNPNALDACRDFAERGDTSGLILSPNKKNLLGIKTPTSDPTSLDTKPDNVQLAEDDRSLTEQVGAGAGKVKDTIVGIAGLGSAIPPVDDPDTPNFIDFLTGLVPDLPGTPTWLNSGSIIMIGGGILVFMLVIVVIK